VNKDTVVPRGPRHGQPLPPDEAARLNAILDRWRTTPGALLPILHDVQAEFGHIPANAVGPIAHALHQSRAEIHGVISFYHDFRRTPAGRHVLKICQAESCQAVGSRALTAHVERQLGCRLGATSADGAVTIEPVYCLGNCACSPAVLFDGELHGRVDAEQIDRLLQQARARS
jgi:formate dehydrogenase subunit gamma